MSGLDDGMDEEWAREAAEEEADRLRKQEPPPPLSPDEFLAWRSPRKVTGHPTRLDNPLWHWLARTRWDAYNANNRYSGPSPFDAGPMWCFDRFGKSETALPGGSVVHIGGEHEDYYDPDFFIYNDVTVVDAAGNIAIHGYPAEDFPPTDFHSATLVGQSIIIIGCLGYGEQREAGTTPVYRLELSSMQIRKVETSGPPPGWIFKHSARLEDDGVSIVVSGGERWQGPDVPITQNIDSWSLDTAAGAWKRLTARNWQRWIVQRTDRKRSRLWDVRQAMWHRDHAHLGLESHWQFDDQPDFAAVEMLYRLDEGVPRPIEGKDFNTFSVVMDGLAIRFKEEGSWVEAIVEGQLAPERLDALQRHMRALLERIEASECVVITA